MSSGESKSEAALREAVRATFPEGTSELTPLTGGRSGALVFGFEAEGQRWVARHSPYRGTDRLRIAAENGVGPSLRYVDVANEIAIMERFEGVPAPGARDAASRARIAQTLRRLHTGPALPPNMPSVEFYALIRSEVAKRANEDVPAPLVDLLADCATRTADAPLAPCHRDLNPGNVHVSPERVCIFDWDSAGAGDPFLDVAQFCVFYAPTPESRAAFLRDYLGREPSEDEAAHAKIAHVYALSTYALAFAYVLSFSGRPVRSTPVSMPEIMAHLGSRGHEADADLVSASFLAEALSRASEARSSAG